VDRDRQDHEREGEEAELNSRSGFTVAELLIAGTLALALMGGVLTVVDPGHAASRAQAAATDIRQRLRAASEALSTDLQAAGSGPVNGALGKALGTIVPSVLPYRIGPRGDPAGSARPDAVSLMAAAGGGAAVPLTEAFVPAVGIAQIAWRPGCPVGDDSCGLQAGASVLLLDGSGQADLFRVVATTGASVALEPRGVTSGRPFGPGTLLVPVTVSSYYLRQGAGADGAQLMSGDGGQADLPLVDHLSGLVIEMLGDPRPPGFGSAGTPLHPVTYGPLPPPLAVDDGRDDWPAGENCTFLAQAGEQRSRLAVLQPGTDLVLLPPDVLTDGPWCPDAASPNRYDADLLRVRAVRVTIRAEATSAAARGISGRLFAHPGTSRELSSVAADQQVVFDVALRALHVGR
jgi:hypothetical protein